MPEFGFTELFHELETLARGLNQAEPVNRRPILKITVPYLQKHLALYIGPFSWSLPVSSFLLLSKTTIKGLRLKLAFEELYRQALLTLSSLHPYLSLDFVLDASNNTCGFR